MSGRGRMARDSGGEKQLACAIINLAIEDALAPSPNCVERARAPSPNCVERARERSEALHFLTGKTAAWAEARHFWCMLADLDPDAHRERMILLCLADDDARRRMRRQLADAEIAA